MTAVKDKSNLQSPVFSLANKLTRVCWAIVYGVFFRLSPVPLFAYRRWLLCLFGASLESSANVYPSVRIWLPANLKMGAGSTLGSGVNVYNQGLISIERNVVISQGAYLCASTHNYNEPLHPLILAPILVKSNAWICTEAFVGPGVIVSEGVVIGARAVVIKNTDAWGVYAGNPATKVNVRKRFE